MVCTLAMMLTLSAGWRAGEAGAASKDDLYGQVAPKDYAANSSRSGERAREDAFLQLLGASSEEEVRDALYNGRSLAEIAAGNGRDAQALIDAQVGELKAQWRERLLSGSITLEQYRAYEAEAASLVADSAYGRG